MRMPLRFRLQHATLLTSFIVLVLTGFALKFPDSWFASMLSLGEHRRHLMHRIAAVVLMGVSVYHIFDIAFSRAGRKLVLDLFPTLDDARGAWQNICYYLGLTSRKPEFARFNYAEKAEYWALVWGMIVMAVTGVMLWAKVLCRQSPAALVARCRDCHSLLRSGAGDSGHHRLALLPGVLRPGRVPDELGVVGRKNDAAPLPRRAWTGRRRRSLESVNDSSAAGENRKSRPSQKLNPKR